MTKYWVHDFYGNVREAVDAPKCMYLWKPGETLSLHFGNKSHQIFNHIGKVDYVYNKIMSKIMSTKRKLRAFSSLRFILPARVRSPLRPLLHCLLSANFLPDIHCLAPVFIMPRRFLSAHILSSLLSDIKISHARYVLHSLGENKMKSILHHIFDKIFV